MTLPFDMRDLPDDDAPPPEDAGGLPTVARAVTAFSASAGRPQVYLPLPGGHAGPGADRREISFTGDELLPPDGRQTARSWWAFYRRWGSWWPGRLAVLVGGTGRGKSSWAIQAAEAVVSAGHPVLYMSCEMDTDELVARLVALRARAPTPADGYGPAWADVEQNRGGDAVKAATERLVADCPALYLWAPPMDKRTGQDLARMAAAVSQAEGGKPPLVVVDYVQRMAVSAKGGDNALRLAVSRLSGELRTLSRPDGAWPGAAVLALSTTARSHYGLFASTGSLQRALEGGTRTVKGKEMRVPPEDLVGLGKESGELEADAPTVLCMTTDDGDDDEPRDALVVWSKNRHGVRKGGAWLSFWPACGRFQAFGQDSPAALTAALEDELVARGELEARGEIVEEEEPPWDYKP